MSRLTSLAAAVAAATLLVGAAPASAQEVGLEDFAWLVGSWTGPGPEGATAEIHFCPPAGGELPSLFRLYQTDGLMLLEVISLREEEGGLFMYVRHFDGALTPLDKEGVIRLRLAERQGDAFVFENADPGRNPRRSVMTRTEQGFVSMSELARQDGSTDTIRVEYRRRDR